MMTSLFKTAEGRELKLSPFVIATTRLVMPKIRQLQQAITDPAESEARTDLKLEVLAESLRRDNEGVDRAWLEEHIQSQELDALVMAAIQASGLVQREPAPPGEAKSP